MSNTTPRPAPDAQERGQPLVDVTGSEVIIDRLRVRDPVLVGLLTRSDDQERVATTERILTVGARGLATMGLGFDLSEVDLRVTRSVERATDEAALRVRSMLDEAHRVLSSSLDPEQRSSMVARTVADFGAWRDSFLEKVDPEASQSHTGRLLDHLRDLLGPGGALEQRLTSVLDPTSDTGGIGHLSTLIEQRFSELRDSMALDRGRRQEAERGTAKGFEFEDRIEEALRAIAKPIGAIVERTSRSSGALAGEAMVGDFVIEVPGLGRIVVEAKNVRALALTGKDSILTQLDRALANRDGTIAVCVSAQDAFPREVGSFAVYGDRILVVDDGEGTMVEVAIRWAQAALKARGGSGTAVDLGVVEERLQRLRLMAQRFSTNRRTLTEISSSVDKVRDSLEDMRRDLVEVVDDASSEIRRGEAAAQVLPLERHVG